MFDKIKWQKEYNMKKKSERKENRDKKKDRTPKGLLTKIFESKKTKYELKWKRKFPISKKEFLSMKDSIGFIMRFNYWKASGFAEQYRPFMKGIHRAWKLSNITWEAGRYWEKQNDSVPLDLGNPQPPTSLDDRTKFVVERLLENNWAGPRSSKDEFYSFLINNIRWNELYNTWKDSGFKPGLKPWIIRNVTKLGLVINNMLLMPEYEKIVFLVGRRNYAAKHDTLPKIQVQQGEFGAYIIKQLENRGN